MTIEIRIEGCDPDDVVRQVCALSDRLNAAMTEQPAPGLDAMPLQELIEVTTKRAKDAGFDLLISTPDIVAEADVVNPDKKARRKKAEPVPVSEVEEADKAEETAYDGDSEDIKSEVIAKCSQLMLDGRRDVVMSLKKMFGRTLSDLPADRFPAISKELERILNDGQSDE